MGAIGSTGVVLRRAGGALAQMLTPFELGLGGPVGSGKQDLPWIHLHDLVKVIAEALVDGRAIARHVAAIRKHCERGDLACRRKQRQAVLHWA